MSVLSFVALELQTTHLDPASVSQVSYVKLVHGNITLVDSWPVIPPTTTGEVVKRSSEQAKTWEEALSQLTMMVGTLPVVSYYRDADKEVLQAASQHSGKTPPEFRWLDCRELAKKYLPDLPEFQLSTVLQALDLFDEYGNSNSVEQTSQIVIELARRHNMGSIEGLWGELYDEPDKLLGLDAGLEGLNFAAVPPPAHEQPAEEVHDEPAPHKDNAHEHSVYPVESGAPEQPPETAGSEELLDAGAPSEERAEDPFFETPLDIENTDLVQESPSMPVEDPGTPPASVTELSLQEFENTKTLGTPKDAGTAATAPDDELEEDALSAPRADDIEPHAPATEAHTSAEEVGVPTHEALEPTGLDTKVVPVQPAATQPRTEERTGVPTFEVGEVAAQPTPEPKHPRNARTIRTLGFSGVFVFGLLTVIGVVLTVMATMLFFTDNSLMLETKIAGVILTGAISVLSLLTAIFSLKSLRDN